MSQSLKKYSFYFAAFGAIEFWSLLSLSIYLHPEFSMFSPQQSLSDLGQIGAKYAYIFNAAIIITGIMYMLATAGMLNGELTRLGRGSLIIFMISLFPYIGIGLFPKGTALHIPLTLTFYGLASVAMFAWCVDRLRRGEKRVATIFIILMISAYVVYAIYRYVGFPFAELYGGTIIMLWVLTSSKIQK
jgi:hypothetical membrane protein